MHFVSRLSVRAIITIVFLTLALALCGALLIEIRSAWQEASLARRLTALAAADRAVFQSVQSIRAERADILSLVQGHENAAGEVQEHKAKIRALLDAAIAAAKPVRIPHGEELIAALDARWNEATPRWNELDAFARKPVAERDMTATRSWYDAIDAVNEGLNRLSLAISSEARIADPMVAELILVRQIAWTVRDFSGKECGFARPFVGKSAPFNPAAHDSLISFRAATNTAWSMLDDLLSRPGVPAALVALNGKAHESQRQSLAERDAVYAKFDDSGQPAVSADAWGALCTEPLDKIFAIGARSLELTEAYTETTEAGATARLIGTLIALLAGLGIGTAGLLLMRRRVAVPVSKLTAAIDALAARNYTVAVEQTGYADEFGRMAETLEQLRRGSLEAERLSGERMEAQQAELKRAGALNDACRDFDLAIQRSLDAVNNSISHMTEAANGMTATAERTSGQSATVAAASEQASRNVNTVASAAEELAASVAEISRQVTEAARIAADAAARAGRTNDTMRGLDEAAQKIGDVVKLINAIAGQTNLLALNATIEAARAGEAGKGFAVVASEVKSLATQTAKATEEISSQIAGIQASTAEAVAAIKEIGAVIAQVNEISTTIAGAVQEQGAATQEIARNVQEAASGTAEVSANIGGVTQAAGEAGTAASKVLGAARDVAAQSASLRAQLDAFLAKIRAA